MTECLLPIKVDFIPFGLYTSQKGFEMDTELQQRRTLWTVLLLNFGAFVLEGIFGYIHNSRGLLADGLDMFSDVCAYGLCLYAIGRTMHLKERIGRAVAYSQIVLLMLGIAQLLRNYETPVWGTMIWVSVIAFAVNAYCLYRLKQLDSADANINAVVLCSSIDVLANLGVILSAGFVFVLNSFIPDLIISVIIYALIIHEIKEMFEGSRCRCPKPLTPDPNP
jgi:Co/Zn/Cd efflux system component